MLDPDPKPKPVITRGEYLQLLGLLTLAGKINRQRRDIEIAAAEILGMPPNRDWGDYGHLSDQVNDITPDADQLIRVYGIRVEDGGSPR